MTKLMEAMLKEMSTMSNVSKEIENHVNKNISELSEDEVKTLHKVFTQKKMLLKVKQIIVMKREIL